MTADSAGRWRSALVLAALVLLAQGVGLIGLAAAGQALADPAVVVVQMLVVTVVLVPTLVLVGRWRLRGERARGGPTARAGGVDRSPSAHQRVRYAMHLALAAVAVMALLQAWHVHRQAQARQFDAQLIGLAAAQQAAAERLGRLALQAAATAGRGAPGAEPAAAAAAAGLQAELIQSMDQALTFQNLMHATAMLDDNPMQAPALQRAQDDWQAARERLWYRAQALLDHLHARRAPLVSAAAEAAQQEADRSGRAAGELVQALQTATQAQGAADRGRADLWTVATLAVLLYLSLSVAEPIARSVRRQYERLHDQTAELERLALVAARTHNLVVVTDTERRIVWANEAFTRTTGWRLDEVRGRTPGSFLQSPRTDAQQVARMREALAARRGVRVEILNTAKDGREYWLDADIQPLHDEQGRLSGFVAVEVDITEQVLQRQRMAALLAALPAGVVVQAADGAVVEFNRGAEFVLGVSRDLAVGKRLDHAVARVLRDDQTDYPVEQSPGVRTLRDGVGRRNEIMGIVRADGQTRWLLVNTEPIEMRPGQPFGVVSCFIDVTEQRAQQALMQLTIEGAGIGVWRWDLGSGRITCNERLLRMLGYEPGAIEPTLEAWSAIVHPDDIGLCREALRSHLDQPQQPYHVQVRLRRPDGQWAAVLQSGTVVERDVRGKPRCMSGIHVDMTEHMEMQAMLRHTARTDQLTQLPNRTVLVERVQRAIERHRQDGSHHYAVLFMDFDRFKQVNDTLGHAAGDELLRQIAQRLSRTLRAGDALARPGAETSTAARIGGDEFVVVLDGIRHDDDATAVGDRLLEVLSRPYRLGTQTVHSTASIGIVTSALVDGDADAVMRDADTAMYEAKRAGRGRWVMFNPAMHQRVARQAGIEHDLRDGLARGELFVVYQPIVDLATRDVVGTEALARWRHPKRGLVPPVEFIPVAEESGLIAAVGAFVLHAACRQFVAWQRRLGMDAPSLLAVNLSRAQLGLPGLVDDVRQALNDSGLSPRCLQLEVTESLAAQDDKVQATLRELKSIGVTLALDDFGTGYSSLACLHQLPVDVVKIDRSFVRDAESSEYHRVLIEATVRVARTLGMGTVAEGIETAGQAALLQRLQCQKGQGYLYSKPLTAEEAERWIGSAAAEVSLEFTPAV